MADLARGVQYHPVMMISVDPCMLRAMLTRGAACASDDDTRPHFCVVVLDAAAGRLTATATNGQVICRLGGPYKGPDGAARLVVPADEAARLAKVLPRPRVKGGCRVAGDHPDWELAAGTLRGPGGEWPVAAYTDQAEPPKTGHLFAAVANYTPRTEPWGIAGRYLDAELLVATMRL